MAQTPPLFSLQLQPGQCMWQHLPRAADITVTEGAIRIHQRVELAGEWVNVPVLVRAGEPFRVSGGGWVEMEGMAGAAQVDVRVAPGWWQVGRLWRGGRVFQRRTFG